MRRYNMNSETKQKLFESVFCFFCNSPVAGQIEVIVFYSAVLTIVSLTFKIYVNAQIDNNKWVTLG